MYNGQEMVLSLAENFSEFKKRGRFMKVFHTTIVGCLLATTILLLGFPVWGQVDPDPDTIGLYFDPEDSGVYLYDPDLDVRLEGQ